MLNTRLKSNEDYIDKTIFIINILIGRKGDNDINNTIINKSFRYNKK